MKKRDLGSKLALYPNPLLLVGTYDDSGKPNVMTVGWGGICNSRPPCVAISVRKETNTYQGLINRKAFTINIPDEKFINETSYFGIASGHNVNKFEETGLTPIKSDFIDAPYIEEIPLNIECEVIQTIEIGSHTQFIGLIKNVKIDSSFDEEKPIIERLNPIIYGVGDNHQYYTINKKLKKPNIKGRKLK